MRSILSLVRVTIPGSIASLALCASVLASPQ